MSIIKYRKTIKSIERAEEFRRGHSCLAFEHFQEIEIIFKTAFCAGFCNAVSETEHPFGLFDAQMNLHLLDGDPVYMLKDGVQSAICFSEGCFVVFQSERAVLIVIDIFQYLRGEIAFLPGPQCIFLHGQAELMKNRLHLRGQENVAAEGRHSVAEGIMHQIKAGQIGWNLSA